MSRVTFLVSDNSRYTFSQSKLAKVLYWISHMIGIYPSCLQIHLKNAWLKLSVIFSFALISSKPANGLRSFLPNSNLCLTLDNNSFSKGFSSYCNCISFFSSEKHSTEFDAFVIYVAFLVTTVSSAIQTSPFSWMMKQQSLLNKTILFSYNAAMAEYRLTFSILRFH